MAPWRTKVYLLLPIVLVIAVLWLPARALAQEFKTYKNDKFGFSMDYPATWKPVKTKPVYEVVLQSPAGPNELPSQINVACQKPYAETIADAVKKLQKQVQDLRKEPDQVSKSVKIVQGDNFECIPGAYWLQLEALDADRKMMVDIVLVYYQHQDVLLRVSCITRQGNLENMFPAFNKVLCSVKFHQPVEGPVPLGTPSPAPQPGPGMTEDQQEPQPAPAPQTPNLRYPAPPPRTQAPAVQPVQPAVQPEPEGEPYPGVQPVVPAPGTRAPAPLQRLLPQPETTAPGSGTLEQPSEAPRSTPRGPTGGPPRPPATTPGPTGGGIVN